MNKIEIKRKEEIDLDLMREDITKVTEREIDQNKKREIIKLKEMRIQMISIIIKENTTAKESTITNILDSIETIQGTDITNDFALIFYIVLILHFIFQ
jgi:hypothetical protein